MNFFRKLLIKEPTLMFLMVGALVLTAAWFIPTGRLVFYPLTLLSTWFHEAGHALATLLIGGRVAGIQIYSNLSGINYSSIPVGTSKLGQAFVAAGGPLMPSIFGGLLILSGKRSDTTKYALFVLAAAMFASVIISSPDVSIGMALVAFIALGLAYAATKLDRNFLKLLVHIIGIEAVISIFSSFSYLSETSATLNDRTYQTDTQLISSFVGGNNIFWAIFLTSLSVSIMVAALYFSLKPVVEVK